MPEADVELRHVDDGDVAIFYEHQRDALSTHMAGFPARSREDHDVHWDRIRSRPEVFTRAILYGSQVVGNIVSWVQDGRREVGFWLGREYWGLGIATRALDLFLAIPEVTLPVYAHVAVHNSGSIRVLEKCGFVLMGDVPEVSSADEVVLVRT